MKTINIKGKEYAMVNERIKAFRKEHPTWALLTDWEHSKVTEKDCLIVAVVSDENGRNIASGVAHEDKDASAINKTSYIENCETSAWGRVLANLGYGIDGSIASAEELAMAISKQEGAKKPISEDQLTALMKTLHEKNVKEADICKAYKVTQLEELTREQYENAMHRLEKTEKKEA